jgi:hypothetical protein
MASRAEKLRRRQHRKEKKRRRAQERETEFAPADDFLVVEPPGAVRMSEVLLELVEPEWSGYQDEAAMRGLLTIAMAAWNAALMNGAERMDFLAGLADAFPSGLRREFAQTVELFIRRKEELFPDIDRPILGFELTWRSGNPCLFVMSGLE